MTIGELELASQLLNARVEGMFPRVFVQARHDEDIIMLSVVGFDKKTIVRTPIPPQSVKHICFSGALEKILRESLMSLLNNLEMTEIK